MYSSFKRKVVVVTGAASGIGEAQVNAFLDAGAVVLGIDKELMERKHINFFRYNADFRDEENIRIVCSEIKNRFSKIDVLCNTAGVLDNYNGVFSTDIEQWDEVMTINLRAMFIISKEFSEVMIAERSGAIINMSSVAGQLAGSGGIAYTTSKHAINGLTKHLALELANQGIRVNAIAPGCVKTPMNNSDFDDGGYIADKIESQIPIRRWTQPEEIAELTLFLASDSNTSMQGSIVNVDGGWTIKS